MSDQNPSQAGQSIPLPGTTSASGGRRRKRANMVAHIDSDLCTGCEACQDFCPTGCISTIPGENYETIGAVNRIDEGGCVGCFICLEYCRWEAILKVPGHQPDPS
jgi:formate hydrogenlyase subunit 6/NADH:ubiquinone oxidoreductase subunit I